MTYHALWGYLRMVPAMQAFQRLSMARAVNNGMGTEGAEARFKQDVSEAFAP